jgi:hypothetical protein
MSCRLGRYLVPRHPTSRTASAPLVCTTRAVPDATAAAVFQVVAVPAEGNLVKYSSARVCSTRT